MIRGPVRKSRILRNLWLPGQKSSWPPCRDVVYVNIVWHVKLSVLAVREKLMATIEHSEIIKAPPERVFELLRRVEDFADYSDLIRSIDTLGNDRYRWHVRAVGMDWSFEVAVTEIRPPYVLAWESLEGVKNQGRYQLRAVPGGTEVGLTLNYEIRNRLMAQAVNKAAKPLVGKVSRQILERVEARLHE